MATELSLSVQYGVADARLPRWRLRRWVQYALAGAAGDGHAGWPAPNSACAWWGWPRAGA